MRGGRYSAASVRIHKSVGSALTDRAARYDDIAHFKHDVRRAERVSSTGRAPQDLGDEARRELASDETEEVDGEVVYPRTTARTEVA